ncbi:hypothetical protein Anas_00313 [Armadillidium nasatum]|uniref:SEC7 domain-containing protein n=1 Tax=Armadillidium nasatum TaxID=96803 RepID=A0A5N5THA5_9CRUS|nr:hypothetical protein Anas_00313 [Armadillidium nasatum]
MSCVPDVSISGHLVVQILGVCGQAYGRGNASMKSASQSAAVQSIIALLNQILAECEDQEKNSSQKPNDVSESQSEIYDFVAPAFDELVPLINYIAEKLSEAHKHRESKKEVEIPALFLLECTNSILKGLSSSNEGSSVGSSYSRRVFKDRSAWQPPAYCSTLLVSALWQRLCPALIALLGTPVSMRVCRGSGRTHGQLGRGSGTSSLPSLLFNSQEAKAIYSVACNLVVAMGTVGEMRPVLESLFHRMLLYPPPSCRQDSLREIGEILKDPLKLVQLAGPILHSDPRNHYQCDLSLFRFRTMDSLIECSNYNNPGMQMMTVTCISLLLSSLEELCDGKSLSLLHTTAINETFPNLEDVDYTGPVTYGSHDKSSCRKYECSENLSSDSEIQEVCSHHSDVYDEEGDEGDECNNEGKSNIEIKSKTEDEGGEKNTVEDELNQDIKDNANEVEQPAEIDVDIISSSSGDTEGPIDEAEYDNKQKMFAEEDSRLQRLSEGLGPPSDKLRTLKDEEQEREQLNAQHFCITLQALLPSLLAIRSTIEVDEAVLEFSSKYCQGVYSHCMESKNCPIIINADGIYLSTYAALSLNLKLIRSGFYCQGEEASLLMSQEQFVESVYGSGVLVYLSTSWIGEVYNQVVKDSFLQRAGYNPQSPCNCALINLITDLDGLGSIENGSQMLSDYRRLEKAAMNVPKSASKDAGRKVCRRIVTCCWESILSILGTVLGHLEEEGGIFTPIRLLLLGESIRKDEARRGQDTLILCLNSLQSTARLANELG